MKRLLIIPVLLLFTLAANAQLFTVFGHEVGFIYAGPKVGGTFSTISNFSDMTGFDTKNRMAYQIGAVGEFGFTSKLSVETEVLFYSRGTQLADIDGKIKMNYIGIPILAKYAFKAFGLTKVYATGGTFTDIRTGGEWSDQAVSSPLSSDFKKFDWGLSFGAGAEYPMDKGIWGLDFRYNVGMSDIHDAVGESYKTRSRSFGFSLIYKFDLVDLFSQFKNRKSDTNENTEGGSQSKPGLKVDRSNG